MSTPKTVPKTAVSTNNNNKASNLQDTFLNALRKENTLVFIYLVNGIKLQGIIDSFDQYVIYLKSGGICQMVYKHAISTIVPSQPVKLPTDRSSMASAGKRKSDNEEEDSLGNVKNIDDNDDVYMDLD